MICSVSGALTITSHVCVSSPEAQVIVAMPALTPTTVTLSPVSVLREATLSSLLDQVTDSTSTDATAVNTTL